MLKHKYAVAIFILSILGFAFSFILFNTSLHGLWIVSLLFLAVVTWGVFDIRLGYFLPVFYRSKQEKNKRIALTFDDGPTVHTQAILELLEQYNAKATFFCIGQRIEQESEILKRIYDQKHLIGNHTYTHAKNTGFLSTARLLVEIRKNDQLIEKLIGVRPIMFRPPFGVTNPNIAKAIKKTGHSVIGWDIRSLDTVIQHEERILKKVISKLKPGSVLLFHDTTLKTVRIVEQLLIFLKDNNYDCVTIEDLFEIKAYETVVK